MELFALMQLARRAIRHASFLYFNDWMRRERHELGPSLMHKYTYTRSLHAFPSFTFCFRAMRSPCRCRCRCLCISIITITDRQQRRNAP